MSVLLTVIKNTFRLRVFGNELYHAAVSETMFPNGKISCACAFKLLEEISGGLGNFQGRSLNLVRFPNRNAFEIVRPCLLKQTLICSSLIVIDNHRSGREKAKARNQKE